VTYFEEDEDSELYDSDDEFQEYSQVDLSSKAINALRSGTLEKELEEEELLIVRFIDSMNMREAGSPTVNEIWKLLNWHNRMKIGVDLINLILSGDVHIYFDENDVEGYNPTFSLTHKGKERKKGLMNDN